MAETIGTISRIKVGSTWRGTADALDFANIELKETSTGEEWLFHLYVSREDDLPVHRVVGTQRLALAREAAFRKLTVHVFSEPDDSSFVETIWVDTP